MSTAFVFLQRTATTQPAILTVLSGLIRKITKGATALNVEDPQSLEKTCAALGAGREPPA